MGYTKFSCDLISRHLDGVESVLDFGSQNDYRNATDKPPFVSDTFYKENNITDYTCIDLAGDNNAIQLNWTYPIYNYFTKQFSLIVDAGSSEHSARAERYLLTPFHDGYINSIYPIEAVGIELGYYNCWLNKHDLCKIDGLIISENPKTGHWPQHGYSYLSEDFYKQLAAITDYEILELGENCSMGNCETGINIYSVLKKKSDKFPDFEIFSMFDIKDK